MQSSYEVIRVMWQDSNPHIVSDYVSGESLGEYLIQHPNIEKSRFFSWMSRVLEQLEAMERAKGAGQYPNITPFYIILKADRTVALLNLNAEVNRAFLKKISTYSVLKKFYPEDAVYEDIYSFGKTLQFVLAKSSLIPDLTRREVFRLQKIITRCLTTNSKRRYQSFADIALEFPMTKKTNRKKQWGIMIAIIVLFILLLGNGIYKRIVAMHEKNEISERTLEISEEATKSYRTSIELALGYIRLTCQSENMTKEEKEEKISEIIGECVGLLETQRFQTLQREYGFKVEGENVWLER